MKKLFFSSILRRRFICSLSLILLAFATAMLGVSSCLFYSATALNRYLTGRYQAVPIADAAFGAPYSDVSTLDTSWFLDEYIRREQLYSEVCEALDENPRITREDRRFYLGYSENVAPLRSVSPTVTIGSVSFVRFHGVGTLFNETPYRQAVADVTLVKKEVLDPGGNPLSEGYEGNLNLIGGDVEGETVIFEASFLPTYLYTFEVNAILAQNTELPIGSKLIYVTIGQEVFETVDLEEGYRCLLYGNCLSTSGKLFSEGTRYAKRLVPKPGEDEIFYMELDLENEAETSAFVVLPDGADPVYDSLESFTESSRLSPSEAEWWYSAILSCRETSNALYVVTTEDSDRILPFNTQSMYIIEGKKLTSEDENACLISGELAQERNLRVGDSLVLNLHETEITYLDNTLFLPDGLQEWTMTSYGVDKGVPVSYEIVGIYKSLGWVDFDYTQYLSPNTVYVTASTTPVIGEETPTHFLPQILWGYYLNDPHDAENFTQTLPESIARYIHTSDQDFSYVKPQIVDLAENTRNILIISLAVWALITALFLFLNIVLQRQSIGTLRSLGATAKWTGSTLLSLCMALWLCCALIGGIVCAVSYQSLENSAFSEIAESSLYAGSEEWKSETATEKAAVTALAVVLQGAIFAGVSWATVKVVTRKKPTELLRSN
ncbi:MAG: hypothetical protein Q4C04_05720 [Clostridia bacterium]|nr:hypothetical protein [Clostridia bacterium]